MISPVQHLRTGRPQADTEEEEEKIILQQSSTIISTTNMQTVSLLFCIMIAVATADDAAAPATDAPVAPAADAPAPATDAPVAPATDAPAPATDAPVAPATDAPAPATDAPAPATDAPVAPTCHDGWHEFEGRCFQYVPRVLTWAAAERNCKNLKSHLASVHNHHEYQFIQTMIRTITQSNGETWIGGSDCQQKDTWLWSDGSIFFWTFWCAGHRSTSGCLQMNHGGEDCWHEDQCSSTLPSVCAYSL
ncbi:type-2 ice-structuring protein-like isoform X1 [Epinephelus moara]|uniref:type-2 ice-structuring protein-like isoform X1 n=1 Tax=Epinephelus moara TaxID=300413 RepID=UPI00214EB39E|nr:type-2 ice-structuring protein-like isoform X1 [Epinephelus moara]